MRHLSLDAWKDVARRTAKGTKEDQLTDRAAALTYYGVLAIFPALIVLVSLIGLVGEPEETSSSVTRTLEDLLPEDVVSIVEDPITSIARSTGTAGALLSIGLVIALWTASGYVGAFIRAMNAIHDVTEGRPVWRLRPVQLLLTLGGLLAAAAAGVALVVSGPIARAIGESIGLGDTAVMVWNWVKLPVIALLVVVWIGALYWAAPDVQQRRFRLLTPGAVLAVIAWGIASAGFGFYAANFGSYNKTYGTLGGAVILLVWLWITNVVILVGAELDSEIDRARAA